jgi:hypothetical protein
MSRRNSNVNSFYSKPLPFIHEYFKGTCALCGEHVELKDASRDHIIPRSKGGGNGRNNIQLTHKSCNNLKGDDSYPHDWQEQLKRGLVLPVGYRCPYCSQTITKWHTKNEYMTKAIIKGRVMALHLWCNKERIKYGKLI